MNVMFASTPNASERALFKDHTQVKDLISADIVVFLGGADIRPELYRGERHPTMFCIDSIVDTSKEVGLWRLAKKIGVPCVGICRGGQFLNVMNGGDMYQDVDNHTVNHPMTCSITGKEMQVTSTHHQMMIPTSSAWVLATADGRSTCRRWMENGEDCREEGPRDDTEVVFYLDTADLCFQPHPEFPMQGSYDHDMKSYFFELIEDFVVENR